MVTAMFDNVLGLILTVLSLVYLAYAMLRPEKF
jgi:K+-transporting ATPase KdpF subunit